MYKTMILPVITAIFLGVQALFGVSVEEKVVNDVANAISILIATGITVYGIFKNHKKEGGK